MSVDDDPSAHFDFGTCRQRSHGVVIVRGNVQGQRTGGDRAVHGAGVEPVQAEMCRHRLRNGRLARPGRPVDGDDESPGRQWVVPGEVRQVIGKSGVAGLDGTEAGDEAALAGDRGERSHGGSHRHAVITLAVEAGAVECGGAGDRQRVSLDVRRGAERLDHGDHRRQAVDLLDPQLADVGEDGGPPRHRCGHGQGRDLVEGGDLGGGDGGGRESVVGSGGGGGRDGGGAVGGRCDRHLGPHALEDRDVAQAGGPPIDPFHLDPAVGHHATGHHEEGRRRGVARDVSGGDREQSGGMQGHDATVSPRLDGQADPGLGQHLLGVGARGHGLADDGRPHRGQAGQKNGRLHLGARYLGRPVDALQCAAAHTERGAAVVAPALHRRPHARQRLGHPVHGPRRERLVAEQCGLPGEPGDNPRQQSHGCSRVSAVQRMVRLVEAAPPAPDAHTAVGCPFDLRSHRLDCGQGGGHIGSVGEPVDGGGALGQRREEDGAVRDRLLARCPDRAAAGHAPLHHQDAGGRHESRSARQ